MAPAIGDLPQGRLVAVASRDMARARAFADKHVVPAAYASYEELLQDSSVDIVFVATPNGLHAAHVIAAANANKHVLCDKPLATRLSDANDMIRICRTRGVKLGVNFQSRHSPLYRETRRLIGAGVIGQVLALRADVDSTSKSLSGWRRNKSLAGMGAVFNVGVHIVDLVRFLLDDEYVELIALLEREPAAQLEHEAMVLSRMRKGTLVYLHANQRLPNFRSRVEIYGSVGRIVASHPGQPWFDGQLEVTTPAGTTGQEFLEVNPYAELVSAFNRAVVENGEPSPSGLDGLEALRVSLAIEASDRRGTRQHLYRRSEPG
jgi:1,5-anhydro-D-fructose reductase (1,5-anhydro-D-mannitol-forming)